MSNALETEENALITLFQILYDHRWSSSSITIFSDSHILLKESSQKVIDFNSVGLFSVCLKHISRNFNLEADALAKKGLLLDDLLITWV